MSMFNSKNEGILGVNGDGLKKKEITSWEIKDFITFVNDVFISKHEKKTIEETLTAIGLGGKELIELSVADFREKFGDKQLDVCHKFYCCLLHLKKHRYYLTEEAEQFYQLLEKMAVLLELDDKVFSEKEAFDKFENIAYILSDRDKFSEKYFQPFIEMINVRKLHDRFYNEFTTNSKKSDYKEFCNEYHDKLKELKESLSKYLRQYEKKFGDKLNINYFRLIPDYLFEDEHITFSDDQNMNKMWQIGGGLQNLKVKLVLMELFDEDDGSRKMLRKIISPIISKLPAVEPKFGIFHIGIIVGPWFLEWQESSIITPKDFASDRVFFAVDIQNLPVFEIKNEKFNLQEIGDKVVDVVYKWNTQFIYRNLKRNCQHFVDDIINVLGIRSLEKSKMLEKFFGQLRKTGRATVEFSPTENFRKKFELSWKKKIFSTHKELDTFVKGVLEKDPFAFETFKSEMLFLKAIDRSFWLKHLKYPKRKEFEQLKQSTTKTGGKVDVSFGEFCPFQNPHKTFSFAGMFEDLDFVHGLRKGDFKI